MGRSFSVAVLNLDAHAHELTLSEVHCVFDRGERGSDLSTWRRARMEPATALPRTLGLGATNGPVGVVGQPVVPCQSGSCLLEPSFLELTFDSGSAAETVRLDLSSPWPLRAQPVTDARGHLMTCITPDRDVLKRLNPWAGQQRIGIIRRANPDTLPHLEDFLPESTATWMSDLARDVPGFAARPLSGLCLPASHDAGMYSVLRCTSLAGTSKARTQQLDLGEQLSAGIRYFDLRPCVWSARDENESSDFRFGHFSAAVGGQGCLGDRVLPALEQVPRFLMRHPGEVVILKFSHFYDADYAQPRVPQQACLVRAIRSALADHMVTAERGDNLGNRSLDDLLSSDRRLLCVFDDLHESLYAPEQGVLRFSSVDAEGVRAIEDANFYLYDEYSKTQNVGFMAIDQLSKWTNAARRSPRESGHLVLLSHTLTLDDYDNSPVSGASVRGLAELANPLLWELTVAIGRLARAHSLRPPNLIYADFVDSKLPLGAAIYLNRLPWIVAPE